MSKRPTLDLMALIAEQAAPMPEAVQRVSKAAPPAKPLPEAITRQLNDKSDNLQGLCFKVSAVFRKRFKQRAVAADLKLNELLFEALDAWEDKHKLYK